MGIRRVWSSIALIIAVFVFWSILPPAVEGQAPPPSMPRWPCPTVEEIYLGTDAERVTKVEGEVCAFDFETRSAGTLCVELTLCVLWERVGPVLQSGDGQFVLDVTRGRVYYLAAYLGTDPLHRDVCAVVARMAPERVLYRPTLNNDPSQCPGTQQAPPEPCFEFEPWRGIGRARYVLIPCEGVG